MSAEHKFTGRQCPNCDSYKVKRVWSEFYFLTTQLAMAVLPIVVLRFYNNWSSKISDTWILLSIFAMIVDLFGSVVSVLLVFLATSIFIQMSRQLLNEPHEYECKSCGYTWEYV